MSERIYYSEEAKHRAERRRIATALAFMLLGAGIGAVLAMLFAPEEGEELRGEISNRVSNQVDNGLETANHAIRNLEDKYNDLRKYVDETISKIKVLNN
ncbi:MAG: YtxH domain-containing protein [Chloroflexi bacterium]|nr:YtxH domain-containing protein [Chloroflexota bacterium]